MLSSVHLPLLVKKARGVLDWLVGKERRRQEKHNVLKFMKLEFLSDWSSVCCGATTPERVHATRKEKTMKSKNCV